MRQTEARGMSGHEQGGESVLVTLTVADQLFAVPVSAVRDVLDDQIITPVPLAPREVAGHLNLRGRIVTAICLRRRLGLPERAHGGSRMAVVAEHAGEYYALLVDSVGEVLSLDSGLHEPPPATMPPAVAAFAHGVFRLPERLLLLLSVERLLDIRPRDAVTLAAA